MCIIAQTEITHMFINASIDTQMTVSLYSKILFSNENKWMTKAITVKVSLTNKIRSSQADIIFLLYKFQIGKYRHLILLTLIKKKNGLN